MNGGSGKLVGFAFGTIEYSSWTMCLDDSSDLYAVLDGVKARSQQSHDL